MPGVGGPAPGDDGSKAAAHSGHSDDPWARGGDPWQGGRWEDGRLRRLATMHGLGGGS